MRGRQKTQEAMRSLPRGGLPTRTAAFLTVVLTLVGGAGAIMPSHPTEHPQSALWMQESIAGEVDQSNVGLALDSELRAHIVFARASAIYANPQSVGWTEEDIAPGGARPDIATDADDEVHVAYRVGFSNPHATNYATRSASGWSIEPIDEEHGGGFNRIQIDQSGFPHVVYGGADALRYAVRGELGWSKEVVCPEPPVYFGFDLDAAGRAHVVCQMDATLRYATNSGGTWVASTIPAAGGFPDLAVDAAGGIHVAFQSTAGRLGYAHLSQGTWHVQSVDVDSWTGRFASIDVDSTSRPHITYGDQYGSNSVTGAKARYATRLDDGTWIRTVVGPIGWTAFNSELRIGADDIPQVLYRLGSTQGVQTSVDRLVLAKPVLASVP